MFVTFSGGGQIRGTENCETPNVLSFLNNMDDAVKMLTGEINFMSPPSNVMTCMVVNHFTRDVLSRYLQHEPVCVEPMLAMCSRLQVDPESNPLAFTSTAQASFTNVSAEMMHLLIMFLEAIPIFCSQLEKNYVGFNDEQDPYYHFAATEIDFHNMLRISLVCESYEVPYRVKVCTVCRKKCGEDTINRCSGC